MGVGFIVMDFGLIWRIDIDVFIDIFKYFIKYISFDLE